MKKIIIANWKCNPTTLKEAQKMFSGLKQGIKQTKAEVVVCPPFVYLQPAAKDLKGVAKLGAQDCFWETAGAFTSQISPIMLKDLGVQYVILGHSERRIIMNETTLQVSKKIKAALSAGLIPVVCFGESLEEKQQGNNFVSIEKELEEMLEKISKIDIGKIIFAYEPDWAIGTGHNCSPDDALTVALFLKKFLLNRAGRQASQQARFIYGGSVNSYNAAAYLQHEALSGLLVGGASLNIKEFLAIIRSV